MGGYAERDATAKLIAGGRIWKWREGWTHVTREDNVSKVD